MIIWYTEIYPEGREAQVTFFKRINSFQNTCTKFEPMKKVMHICLISARVLGLKRSWIYTYHVSWRWWKGKMFKSSNDSIVWCKVRVRNDVPKKGNSHYTTIHIHPKILLFGVGYGGIIITKAPYIEYKEECCMKCGPWTNAKYVLEVVVYDGLKI